MFKIPVEHVRAGETASLDLSREMDNLFEEVSKRAFELFLQRGSIPGNDRNDWLQAERELIWSPPIELIETESQFKLRLAAPGYEPGDIRITALPDAIIVRAEAGKESRKRSGTVHISELRSRMLYRRVPLSSTIDVDAVAATLEGGLLLLTATKANANKDTAKVAAATGS